MPYSSIPNSSGRLSPFKSIKLRLLYANPDWTPLSPYGSKGQLFAIPFCQHLLVQRPFPYPLISLIPSESKSPNIIRLDVPHPLDELYAA